MKIKKNLHNNMHSTGIISGLNQIIPAADRMISKLNKKLKDKGKSPIGSKKSKKIRYGYVCASLKTIKTFIKVANVASKA